jgi:hypothetical protein
MSADIGLRGEHLGVGIPNGRVVIVPRSKSRQTANEVLKQAALPKSF